MLDFENALAALRLDILKIDQLERDRIELLHAPLNPARKDEREAQLKKDIERQRGWLLDVLHEVVDFPPQHSRHENLLDLFHLDASYDKSVFVMTKFPDPAKPAPVDAQLEAVIKAVRDAVTGCGYEARLANDKVFHPILWDNVELYLLGCNRGIAIVEDKYLPELNPNVAMEWGWMRGMGRNVLYLVEKDFKKGRADWGGLIESRFDWANPVPDIEAGIKAWLK
jgi:hypothetical protein